MKQFNQIFEKLKFIPILLLGLVPLIWFSGKGNVLVNGIDTNFPLDPLVWFLRRFFVWNSIANAGMDFSSSTAGLFFHLIQVIPFVLGFNLQIVEIFSFIFWFSLISFSSFIFARIIFPKMYLAQVLFAVFYSFNIYIFNTWENVKVANLSLMAAIPVTLSIIELLRLQKIRIDQAILYSVIAGIIVSGTGINPAYFLSFLLTIFIYFMAGIFINFDIKIIFKRFKQLSIIFFFIIAVNSFWIIPTIYFIYRNIPTQGSIYGIGFNNWINSLSENTSLINVMRLQGAWDWYAFDSVTDLPLYIPYVLNYFYNPIFIIFSFLITSLTILSLVLKNEEKKYLQITFGLMFIVGIFLSSGTHPPTGFAYKWMTDNISFFSLFRSPWYIFAPLVVLSTSGAIALFFYTLRSKIENLDDYNQKSPYKNKLLNLSVLILIIGILFYSYPLFSGKIFRPGREDSFYVTFPNYVFDVKEWLKGKDEGRIIGYPEDEIEQFKWGYRGIESILGLLSERELLFSPLNLSQVQVVSLILDFYKSIKADQQLAINSYVSKLNISAIFEKNDQKSLSSKLPPSIKKLDTKKFGEWSFYTVPDDVLVPKIYSAEKVNKVFPYDIASQAFPLLKSKEISVNPEDNIVNQIPLINDYSNITILTESSQVKSFLDFKLSLSKLSNRIFGRDLSKVEFKFYISRSGFYQPLLEKHNLSAFGIDLTKPIKLIIDGKDENWEINDTNEYYIKFKPVFLSKGNHKIILNIVNNNLVYGGNFDKGFVFAKGGEGRGEGLYNIEKNENNEFLSILNIEKADISADFEVTSFNPLESYYIEVKYKQIYGNNAKTLVTQFSPNTLYKAEAERMPNYPEWKTFSFYYEPVRVQSKMRVELVAPFIADPLGTKVLYDDLKVYKVFSNKLLFTNQSEQQSLLTTPPISFRKNSPVEYSGEVRGVNGPHIIVFSENYSDEWDFSLQDINGLKLNVLPNHFSANIYANAWYIEGAPSEYKFVIYYRPQNLFWAGLGISTIALLFAFVYYFIERRK